MGLQSARSTFGFTFSSLPLGILNLFSLLLFPWTLSILLSPGLIWYSTNWLHQKVIMLHTIVTLLFFFFFLPLFTSNLFSTCEICFTGSKKNQMIFTEHILTLNYCTASCFYSWSWWLNVLCVCCRENLPAVLPQSHRAVRAAEETRPGGSVPDSPLPGQNPTQVRPTKPRVIKLLVRN